MITHNPNSQESKTFNKAPDGPEKRDDSYKNVCLVVGTGAIGLAFAWDMYTSPQCHELVLWGRTPIKKPVLVNIEDKLYQLEDSVPFYTEKEWDLPPKALHPSEKKTLSIFITVSPSQCAVACQSILMALYNIQPRTRGFRRLDLYFCMNGLLETEVAEAFMDFLEPGFKVTAYRALIYSGFQRKIEQDKTVLIHGGGQDIAFGIVEDLARFFKIFSFSKVGMVDSYFSFFKWRRVHKINITENTKFFVNFALALLIGPKKVVNGSVLEERHSASSTVLAAVWSQLFPGMVVDSSSLQDALSDTAKATHQNVNSVSLAGFNGDASQMEHFISLLAPRIYQLAKNRPSAELTWLKEEIQRQWPNCAEGYF